MLDSPNIDEVAVVGIHFVGLPLDEVNPVFRIRFDALKLAEADRKSSVFHGFVPLCEKLNGLNLKLLIVQKVPDNL